MGLPEKMGEDLDVKIQLTTTERIHIQTQVHTSSEAAFTAVFRRLARML